LSTSRIDQIVRHLQQDDIPGAVRLAQSAYLNNEFDPLILNLVAFGLETDGDLEGALRVLGESLAQQPDDAMAYTNVGHCLVKLARPTHALEAFNAALRIDPNLPRAHHGAGLALWMRGEHAAGDAAQRRAIQLDPNYPDPYGALAVSLAQHGDQAQSAAMADRALELNPNEIQALMLVADRLFASKAFEDCAALLRRALADPATAPLQRVSIHRKLGNCLDRLGRYPDAFEAYRQSNAYERRVYKDLFEAEDIESQPEKLKRLTAHFRSAAPMVEEVPAGHAMNGVRQHVFVMSFPRSGTTLLEQVLASHPDIIPLEEQPTLSEAMAHFFNRREGLAELMAATEAELEPWRQRYWEKVAGYLGPIEDKVFVDKQPSLTAFLPLIRRLFPHARIVFNIRDPRDVILSCFRHGFVMNANMYEYTDILTLAQLYSLTMECAHVYFETLNLNVYKHRHEEFITNFEPKTRELCEFLGLTYNENMRNFVETAKKREINTPSRDQVRAGLNTSGMAYWRNYADQLREAAEIVKPWVTAYGYPD